MNATNRTAFRPWRNALVLACGLATAMFCASCGKSDSAKKTSPPSSVSATSAPAPDDLLEKAMVLEKAGDPASQKQAVELYTKAADAGYPPAQYRLGLCYKAGVGVEVNSEKATAYLTQAANHGNEGAKQALAALTAPIVQAVPAEKPVKRATTKQAIPLLYAARADNDGGAYATSLENLEYFIGAMPDAREWQPGPCLGKVFQEPVKGTVPVYQFRLSREYVLASDPADVAALRQPTGGKATRDDGTIVFYAYPPAEKQGQSVPIRQYFNEKSRTHFYMMDSEEDISKSQVGIRRDKIVFNVLVVPKEEGEAVQENVAWRLSVMREEFVQTIIKGVAGQWQRTDKSGSPVASISISPTGECTFVDRLTTKLTIQVGNELLLIIQENGAYDAFRLDDLNSEKLEGMSVTPETKVTYNRLKTEREKPAEKEQPPAKQAKKVPVSGTPAQRILASLCGKWQRVDPTSRETVTIEVTPSGACSITEQPTVKVTMQVEKNYVTFMQSTGRCDKFGIGGVTGKTMGGMQSVYANVTYTRIGPRTEISATPSPVKLAVKPPKLSSDVSLRRMAHARKYLSSKVELLAYDYRYPMVSFNAALMTQWLKFKGTTPKPGVRFKPRNVLEQEAYNQIEKMCPEIALEEFAAQAEAQLPPKWKVGDTVEFMYRAGESRQMLIKGRLVSLSGDTARINSPSASSNPVVHPGNVDDAGRAGLFESERPKVIDKMMHKKLQNYLYNRVVAKTSDEVNGIWRNQGYNEVLDEWLGAEEVRRTVAASVPEAREIRALLNAGYVKHYGRWITRSQYAAELAAEGGQGTPSKVEGRQDEGQQADVAAACKMANELAQRKVDQFIAQRKFGIVSARSVQTSYAFGGPGGVPAVHVFMVFTRINNSGMQFECDAHFIYAPSMDWCMSYAEIDGEKILGGL